MFVGGVATMRWRLGVSRYIWRDGRKGRGRGPARVREKENAEKFKGAGKEGHLFG